MTMTDNVEQTPEQISDPDATIEAVIPQVIAQINKGSISLADVLKALSPAQQSAEVPAVLPTAKEITAEQRASMERVPEVFGRVVPTERRALEPVEVAALVDEKTTLDDVKKMAEARLADITVTVHNHFDVALENAEATEGVLRDDNGHYIAPGRAGSPDRSQEFSREVRNYAATLDAEALKRLDDEGVLDHQDYLAMTKQVRVVDEARLLVALQKKPSLIKAIAAATKPGKQGTSVHLRRKK